MILGGGGNNTAPLLGGVRVGRWPDQVTLAPLSFQRANQDKGDKKAASYIATL